MAAPKILAFAGSARRESLNRKLLANVVEALRAEGAEVTVVELGALAIPLYNGDLEDQSGLPEAVKTLVAQGRAHDGYVIASPEYNTSVTPLLKNAIDWMSRSDDDPFMGKVAAVCSASPGMFGGVRSALLVRQILSNLGTLVIPAQCTVSRASDAFDEAGHVKDHRTQAAVSALAKALVTTIAKLGA